MTVRNSIPQYERYGEPIADDNGLAFNIQRIETFLAAAGTITMLTVILACTNWFGLGKGKANIGSICRSFA